MERGGISLKQSSKRCGPSSAVAEEEEEFITSGGWLDAEVMISSSYGHLSMKGSRTEIQNFRGRYKYDAFRGVSRLLTSQQEILEGGESWSANARHEKFYALLHVCCQKRDEHKAWKAQSVATGQAPSPADGPGCLRFVLVASCSEEARPFQELIQLHVRRQPSCSY